LSDASNYKVWGHNNNCFIFSIVSQLGLGIENAPPPKIDMVRTGSLNVICGMGGTIQFNETSCPTIPAWTNPSKTKTDTMMQTN
jgi:hypothetical protein